MKKYELKVAYKSGEVDEMYTRLTGKGWETEATTPEEALREMKENDPETFEQLEKYKDQIERYWVEEITEEPIYISFEAGESRYSDRCVNYLISPDGGIYAEIEIPEEIDEMYDEYGNHPAEIEEYGYLDLKDAILREYKGNKQLEFFWDGREDRLSKWARVNAKVHTEIDED